MLRKHQREVLDIAESIKRGAGITQIIAHVTPGGGKSLLPVILASKLCGSFADKICWIVPRDALQRQAEESFHDVTFRTMLQHSSSIRIATNEENPSRGFAGYVTTYAALAVDEECMNRREFERNRYILVLDEPHHIARDSAYEAAIAPLVNRAKLVLFMSGTLERDDEKRIAFLPYESAPLQCDGYSEDEAEKVGQTIDMTPTATTAIVTYTRAEALHDGAIIRLRFTHIDASAKWLDSGVEQIVESLSGHDEEKASRALWTSISTDFAYSLLDKTLDDWRNYRIVNPRSKMLVVAARQSLAKDYLMHLKRRGIVAGLATMNEGTDALDAIKRFKMIGNPKRFDVLVTVQMAYEGLDCKAITHIACLTNIRSKPWIEQMLARATRFDNQAGIAWSDQKAVVYTPDDPLLRSVIEQIISADDKIIPPDAKEGNKIGVERFMVPITPVSSAIAGDSRESDLLSADERASLEHAMQTSGIEGVSATAFKNALALAGYVHASVKLATPELPKSEQESSLRLEIENYVREYSAVNTKSPMQVNAKIKRRFKKSRTDMSLSDLQVAFTWIKRNMPLNSLFGGRR